MNQFKKMWALTVSNCKLNVSFISLVQPFTDVNRICGNGSEVKAAAECRDYPLRGIEC